MGGPCLKKYPGLESALAHGLRMQTRVGHPTSCSCCKTSRVLKRVPVMSHWQTVFMDASFTTPTRTISSFSQCLFWLNKSFISAPTVPSEEVQSLHVGLRIYPSTMLYTLFSCTTMSQTYKKPVPILQHKTCTRTTVYRIY
jgi:hypothetical protein